VSGVSTKKPRPANPSFEESLAEVESIIERIESGDMGLEEQIEQYARGAEMLRRCREVLDRCEQRVEEITAKLDKPGPKSDTGAGD
jgi:exodeoxyribonuclease VII small subunit